MNAKGDSVINRVLVPVDFSPPSRLAVNYGVAAARMFHSRLFLLNVVDAGSLPESSRIEEQHCLQSPARPSMSWCPKASMSA